MNQSIDVNSNLSGGSIDCTNEGGSGYSCQVQKTCQDGSPLDQSFDVTYTNGEVYDTVTGERFSTYWTELEGAAGTC